MAGDAEILKAFLLYRTYHGCAMPVQTQLASIAAWNDEAHVRTNRVLHCLSWCRTSASHVTRHRGCKYAGNTRREFPLAVHL